MIQYIYTHIFIYIILYYIMSWSEAIVVLDRFMNEQEKKEQLLHLKKSRISPRKNNQINKATASLTTP